MSELVTEILELYQQGHSYQMIATLVDMNPSDVEYVIKTRAIQPEADE